MESVKKCLKRLRRGLILMLAGLILLTPVPTMAIGSDTLRIYSQSNALYYNPDGNCEPSSSSKICVTLPDGTKDCTAGLLSGNTSEEKVWNYFVKANIQGVSDNPAVIAGIIGNLKLESGLDPFATSGGYYGIHMTKVASFKAAVDNAGLSQYWGNGSSAPAEAVNKAIETELDWIVKNNPRWFGGSSPDGGDTWSADAAFLPNLNNVDDTNSPESYSDLFLVTVEGANYQGFGSETELADSKVKALAARVFTGDNGLWQGAKQRREYARDAYDRLRGGASSVPVADNTNFSTNSSYSGSGNIKYDMTEGEMEWLLRFAVWKAGQSNKEFQDVISEILDDYELKEHVKKGDSGRLILFIKEGEKFIYRSDYDNYVTLSTEITITPEQRDVAKQIIVDGLRTTNNASIEVESKGNSSDVCATDTTGATGAARIAQVAVQMSWPVITPEYTEEQGHTGECAIDGRDSNTYSRWIKYNGRGSECDYTPRKLYRENYSGQVSSNVFNSANGFSDRKYMDCSWFVGTVMKYVFGVEYGFPQGGPGYQMAFMESKPEDWQIIPNNDSLDDLQPGDVLAYNTGGNHIMIYVGEYGAEYGEWAQASADDCVGLVETKGNSGWGHFTIYRYIGTALGSNGNCSQYTGGEAVACAAEYMAWPNTSDGWAKAQAGQLSPEYEAARDKWFGPNTNASGGQDNDVSCARFASLVILESGVDPGFAVSSSPSRANIKWLGGEMEGHLASSSNWTEVTGSSYKRGDVFVDTQPHIWIYLGNGLIAEAAGGRSGFNRAGVIMSSNGSSASFRVYRARV